MRKTGKMIVPEGGWDTFAHDETLRKDCGEYVEVRVYRGPGRLKRDLVEHRHEYKTGAAEVPEEG